MTTFSKSVDKRSRAEMVSFLGRHFRYYTMNSWNRSTSYAHNMKIHHLGLEREIADKLYDLIQVEDFYDPISDLIREFSEDHGYQWQAGFNGRSGGYLVLYQGGLNHDKRNAHTFPGRGIDQEESFAASWEIEQLRDRVELICEFDALADAIVAEAVYIAKNYKIKEETIYVPRTRKVLVGA